ncbi:MAG: blaR1 peptidase family protein [Gemmatimonadetes bacterium]|nr:blaR1 peptidase family protein [Gemmatimonadota bacterium]
MMLLRMSYSVVVGLVFALVALTAEHAANRWLLPRRWIWAGSLAATFAASAVLWTMAAPAAPPSFAAVSSPQVTRALQALWVLASAGVAAVLLLSAENLRLRRRRWTMARVDDVDVLVTDGLGPAVVGLFRPVIAMPRWVLRAPDGQRRSIVLREAEHLEAGDHTLIAFAMGAVALMPWNMPLWFHLRRLRVAIAKDCDARVLDHLLDAETSAEPVIEVSREPTPTARPTVIHVDSYLGWHPDAAPQTPQRAD